LRKAILALAAVTFLLAQKCDDKGDEPRPHPGCPGDSIVGADNGDCVCPNGLKLTAGALQCDDCDPASSNGLYCDCARDSVFSLDARIDSTVGFRSPQVSCEEPNDCPKGSFRTLTGCQQCETGQCGACGSCAVGETCISGSCVNVLACRVQDVLPDELFYPYANPRRDRCEFRVGDLCDFFTFADAAVGTQCACADSVDCFYLGRAEALSR
jgi:hypothetical protein